MSTKRKTKTATTTPATRDASAPAVPIQTAPAVRAETAPAVDVPPELERVAQALGVSLVGTPDAPSDLLRLEPATRAQAVDWLAAWLRNGCRYADAMAAAGCAAWVPYMARRQSSTFAAVMDRLEELERARHVSEIETTLTDAAKGQTAKRQGYYAPDVRAAQLYLAASSERYRPGQGAALPSVAIQINL